MKWGAILIAIGLSWTAYVRTDGFSPSAIRASLSAEAAPPPSAEVREILSQPFHYLSKGRQCFVFESADGKYVLKFFNKNYLQTPWYFFFAGEKERAKRARRRHFYENSYAIAYRELGEEICYLHLGSSEGLPAAVIVDRASGEHTVDLNRLPFVVQRKGIPLYAVLEAVYEKEGLTGLRREIDAFMGAVSLRISKNIADGDQDVEHNWGYVDGHIFHLDPGRLYYDDLSEPGRRKEEWRRATHSFIKFILKMDRSATVKENA